MTSTVIDGIQYLQGHRCRKIAILAHSQGAAVAKEALVIDPHIHIDGLITVGSGINKLGGLRRGTDARIWVWLPMLALLAVVVMTLGTLLSNDGPHKLIALAGWTGGVAAALGLTIFIVELVSDLIDRMVENERFNQALQVLALGTIVAAIVLTVSASSDAWKPSEFEFWYALCFISFVGGSVWGLSETDNTTTPAMTNNVRKWLDLYARYDAVPNGPTRTSEAAWPTSLEVRNVDSIILDHNRYARGLDDCVATIGEFLLSLEEGDERSCQRSQDVREAVGWRRWRLSHLRAARWTVVLSVLNLVILIWPELPRYGSQLYAASGTSALPELGRILPAQLDPRGGLLVALGAIAIGGFACSIALIPLWELWESWDRRKAPLLAEWARFIPRYGFLSIAFVPSMLMQYLVPNFWLALLENSIVPFSWSIWSVWTAPIVVPLATASFLSLNKVRTRLAKPPEV